MRCFTYTIPLRREGHGRRCRDAQRTAALNELDFEIRSRYRRYEKEQALVTRCTVFLLVLQVRAARHLLHSFSHRHGQIR